MLEAWERETPGRIETIARALGDIRPSHLSDPTLFDFLALGRRGDAPPLPDAHAWLAEPRPGDDNNRDQDTARAVHSLPLQDS
jgi:tRNA 2-thiocytidine biosynthesis protein TtcA